MRVWIDRLGNSIHVRHTLVPTLWDTQSHSADNPFLNLFSSVDLVLIFQVILSLLALLFATMPSPGNGKQERFG